MIKQEKQENCSFSAKNDTELTFQVGVVVSNLTRQSFRFPRACSICSIDLIFLAFVGFFILINCGNNIRQQVAPSEQERDQV